MCIPPQYLRQFFRWMYEMIKDWSCKFILGYGSPINFWEIESLCSINFRVTDMEDNSVKTYVVPEDEELEEQTLIKAVNYKHNKYYKEAPTVSLLKVGSKKTNKLMKRMENKRVKYYCLKRRYSPEKILKFIMKKPGPRVAVFNTVQTAAYIAHLAAKKYGRDKVEHLSTSLCPHDFKKQYKNIKKRLKNKEDDNWVLIATSCIETGVNLSFKIGFKEKCTLMGQLP